MGHYDIFYKLQRTSSLYWISVSLVERSDSLALEWVDIDTAMAVFSHAVSIRRQNRQPSIFVDAIPDF